MQPSKSSYIHDFENLEIDEIQEQRTNQSQKKKPKYVAEVKWLGFEE